MWTTRLCVASVPSGFPATIEHVRLLHQQGAKLYCWSSGGAEYARQSAEEFGILDCFIAFLPRPNVLLDDQPIVQWRRFVTVHSSSCATQTLEDYQHRVSDT